MRDNTRLLTALYGAVDQALQENSITGLSLGYSIVNGADFVAIDINGSEASPSQSQDQLKYEVSISVAATFHLDGPGYSSLTHSPAVDAIYNVFQETSTDGILWSFMEANQLGLEAVQDDGSTKVGPVKDSNGLYTVSYVQDFRLTVQYDPLNFLRATQELPFQLNRLAGTEDRAYFYDSVLDQHDIELAPSDYINDNNNIRFVCDYQMMKHWSFQIKLDQFELADSTDFFNCCDYHDPGAGAVDDAAGRTYGYRSPMTVNVIEEDGKYYWVVGIRANGRDKEYMCRYPVTLGEWVTVKIRLDSFDTYPNGQITAQIGSVRETRSGISTKVAPAYSYYLLFGFYMRDGYTSAERSNVIGSYRNIRVGDEKSMYKVVPGFNRTRRYN